MVFRRLGRFYVTEKSFLQEKVFICHMKKGLLIILIGSAISMIGCSKCYKCSKSSSSSSSTVGACLETRSEARSWKKDMEKNGYDCRIVPESSIN